MAVVQKKNIFEAAAADELDTVKHMIEKDKIATTTKNDADETPAHVAARTGSLETLKYLLNKTAKLSKATDIHGNTILDLAAQAGALPVVEYLLTEKGMDVHRANALRLKNTVLHVATEAGHLPVLKYLFEKYKLDANLKNEVKQTPVLLAARNGHFEVMKYLIEDRKADATAIDHYDDNILYMCAENGDVAFVKYLLDEKKIKFDINWRDASRGETALQRAVRFNHFPLIKYLVEEKDANPNSRDYFGRGALHEAVVKGDLKSVKFLVEHGAKLDLIDLHSRDPLFTAIDEDVIRYLNKTMGLSRRRRSVLPDSSMVSPLHSSPALSSVSSPLQLSHAAGATELSGSGSSVGGASGANEFSNFLAFVSIFAGSNANSRRRRALLPVEEVRAKMDPVALDVVDSKFDFA